MNILDIGIIIFVLFGAVLGFKRGFTQEVVKALGFIAVIILSYIFKNPLSVIMYNKLPFFHFGIFKNIEVLNIVLYELIAFIICLIVFSIALKLLTFVSNIFEKILNATVILGIPSKIAGAVVGFIYHYIICFVVIYILTIIFINVQLVHDSKYREPILTKTPLLSNVIDKTTNVYGEFKTLFDNRNNKSISENEYKYQALELFLKYDVIKIETLEDLVSKGKVSTFDGYDTLINSYKGEENGNNE